MHLHLHGFEHNQGLALSDIIAGLHQHIHHHTWHGSPQVSARGNFAAAVFAQVFGLDPHNKALSTYQHLIGINFFGMDVHFQGALSLVEHVQSISVQFYKTVLDGLVIDQ